MVVLFLGRNLVNLIFINFITLKIKRKTVGNDLKKMNEYIAYSKKAFLDF